MDQKVFPLWRDQYPMVDAEHTHLLETSAAIHEFLHRTPRHHAEYTAHQEYRKDQLLDSAAHHLAGIKSAHAVGNMEEAKKHGVMYVLAMKELGFDPTAEPPPEVTAKLKNMAATKPIHKFKSHKGDAFALPPAPKEDTEPIQKAEGETTSPHPHSYPWHDGHTDHHRTLQKDAPAPAAPPPNAQAAGKGVATYGKFAGPYGTVDKSQPSSLKFYPMAGKEPQVDDLVQQHGYKVYYAGGKQGQPDLATKNYNTGHLMIYDPSAGSGGDFGEHAYTDSWRKVHELAHALTHKELNAKYGEGRRIGAMGKQRTLHEAKRAVEWEWLAVHKQRELSAQIGIHVSDHDFHREVNTVMHDAVHRAVTGKFTEPSEEGFIPHPYKVPLEQAMSMLHESAAAMSLTKAEPLEKRSENVRQHIVDSASDEGQARLQRYAQGRGLQTRSEEATGVFPQPKGNTVPFQKPGTVGGDFHLGHELSHVLMTSPGQTAKEHGAIISSQSSRHAAGIGLNDEAVALATNRKINRRAGVKVEGSGGQSRESLRGEHGDELRYQAGAVIKPFDDGAYFDSEGRMQKPTGIDHRVNTGQSGVTRLKAARPPKPVKPGILQKLRGLFIKSEALEKRFELRKGDVLKLPGAAAVPPVQPDRRARGQNVASLSGHKRKVATQAKEAAREPPLPTGSAEELVSLGYDLQDAGDYAGAIQHYKGALQANPNTEISHAANLNIGQLEHVGGDPKLAYKYYAQAAKFMPKDPMVHFNMGVAHEDMGYDLDAQNSYKQSLALDPNGADTHYNLGRLYDKSGQKELAVRHFHEHRRLSKLVQSPHLPPSKFDVNLRSQNKRLTLPSSTGPQNDNSVKPPGTVIPLK